MSSKVSIIVPIYNVENYLERCVESLINQTFSNLEIILVNDGSPDKSPLICDEYKEKDERIKVIHKVNGGLSDARNAGLKVSTGEYIIFVDSDDYIELNLVEEAIKVAEKNNSDVVIWGYYADFVDEKEKLISSNKIKALNGSFETSRLKNIPISNETVNLLGYAWNKLYKSQVIKKNNNYFEKGISLVEDIVFNGQVLKNAEIVSFIELPLNHYMQRPTETLGSKFYDNYMELKQMAMESLKELLLTWGKGKKEVNEIINLIGFNALKSTVRLLSKANNYNKLEKKLFMKNLLKESEIKTILENIQPSSLKDKVIKQLMINRNVRILISIYSKR